MTRDDRTKRTAAESMARKTFLRKWLFVCFLLFILLYISYRIGYNTFPVEHYVANKGEPKVSSCMLVTDCQIFHLITMFFNGYAWQGYEDYNLKELNTREKEYLKVLQLNLNNQCVKNIHLFYYTKADLQTINSFNFTNRHKIILVPHNQLLHMADFFQYASKNLVNRVVIAANSDIEVGQQLRYIDIGRLRAEKIMLSLTSTEVDCNTTAPPDEENCHPLNYYQHIAHQSHIFVLSEPLSTSVLEKIDYPINMLYASNGLIRTMRSSLGFRVINPCMTIKTIHHHCSIVRAKKGDKYSIESLGWKKQDIQKNGLAHPATIYSM